MKLLLPFLLATVMAATSPAMPTNALWAAVAAGDAPAAAAAVAAGADIYERDPKGLTLLHVAAQDDHLALLVWLLEQGLDAEAAAHDGTTPLMLAAASGHTRIARVLLARGVRVNAVRTDGRTALTLAESRRHQEVARMLRLAARGAPSPVPRVHRTPPAPASATPWRPSIPPWSPDPPALEIPRAAPRLATLLARIDRAVPLPARPTPPPYRPIELWVGERFVFLPADPGAPHEYPSFETREDVSAYWFEPSYETLAGRFGVVVGTVRIGGTRFVDFRLDGEPVVLRGRVQAAGNIPDIAPVLDLAIARRLYLGQKVYLQGAAVTRLGLPDGQPVRVVSVSPASTSHRPIRVLIETATGRRHAFDAAMSATNVPQVGSQRLSDSLQDVLRPIR